MICEPKGISRSGTSLSLCFYDSAFSVTTDTPLDQPLGGSHSAMCYLTRELALRGHSVTMLSATTNPGIHQGVECLNIGAIDEGLFESRRYDAVIVLNGPAELSELRFRLPKETVLALWNQHAPDQPAIQGLSRRNVRKKWDRIICVSEWHRKAIVEAFRTEPSRTTVLRNAISPAFENLFKSPSDLTAAKAPTPVLVYTSTPFRGLDVLLDVYPHIHSAWPTTTLEIYSSMRVYQLNSADDPYSLLYEKAATTSGVKYVGSVSQRDLAGALKRASFLAYPNTFAETSCITVMEAMAAGLRVVSTALGALPETSRGYADLISQMKGPDDRERFARDFCTSVKCALDEQTTESEMFAERAYDQVKAVNQDFVWRARAAEWESSLMTWCSEQCEPERASV